jgi:hypothetical protein
MSRFRRIRTDTAYEKADREHDIAMAERLLSTGLADDFTIAFDILGWPVLLQKRPTRVTRDQMSWVSRFVIVITA